MPSPREERLVGELGEYASLSRLAEVTGLPAGTLYQLRREGRLVRLGTRVSVRARTAARPAPSSAARPTRSRTGRTMPPTWQNRTARWLSTAAFPAVCWE